MNDRKLDQLFHAARSEPPAQPSEEFDQLVLRAVRHEGPGAATGATSLFDQLNAWFPRLAWTAVAIIALSVVADFGLTATGTPGINDGVTQISAHWLLSASGF